MKKVMEFLKNQDLLVIETPEAVLMKGIRFGEEVVFYAPAEKNERSETRIFYFLKKWNLVYSESLTDKEKEEIKKAGWDPLSKEEVLERVVFVYERDLASDNYAEAFSGALSLSQEEQAELLKGILLELSPDPDGRPLSEEERQELFSKKYLARMAAKDLRQEENLLGFAENWKKSSTFSLLATSHLGKWTTLHKDAFLKEAWRMSLAEKLLSAFRNEKEAFKVESIRELFSSLGPKKEDVLQQFLGDDDSEDFVAETLFEGNSEKFLVKKEMIFPVLLEKAYGISAYIKGSRTEDKAEKMFSTNNIKEVYNLPFDFEKEDREND